MIRIGLIWLITLFLAGCSPDYNWRQVTVGDGVATAFFPDKPSTQERTLPFSGNDVTFSLTSAVVDHALFTVAHAVLPPALQTDEAARQAFAVAVVRSLFRNLGAPEPEHMPAFGEPFVIEGKGPEGPLRLRARVWLTNQALVEGLVTAGQQAFPQAQAEQFLQGVAVAQP